MKTTGSNECVIVNFFYVLNKSRRKGISILSVLKALSLTNLAIGLIKSSPWEDCDLWAMEFYMYIKKTQYKKLSDFHHELYIFYNGPAQSVAEPRIYGLGSAGRFEANGSFEGSQPWRYAPILLPKLLGTCWWWCHKNYFTIFLQTIDVASFLLVFI